MSMIGHLRAITPAQLKELQTNPESVQEFVHGRIIANADRTGQALNRIAQMAMADVRRQIEEKQDKQGGKSGAKKHQRLSHDDILRELESAGVQLPADGPNEDGLSLEKSWHILHYLLTGSAREMDSVLGKVILGGKQIGFDIGYGPARYLEAPEVAQVAKALKRVSKKDLTRRFDLKTMIAAKVYSCRDKEDLESVNHYFEQIVAYYGEAAARGHAMLLYLD